ncbi:MAG: ATP-binding protein [candidate division Zixibacteria bacterium]|jgi:PAS domain S-box-containing protein|nr:ATP-binding protein [candidate division Zixibacteria bacterium]
MSPREGKNKPGFLTRLSSLILIQVVFVFAALALVVYVPDEASRLDARVASLINRLEATSDALKVAPVDPLSAPPATDSLASLLAPSGSEHMAFSAIILYTADSGGSPYVAKTLGEDSEECLWNVGLSPNNNRARLQALLDQPAGFATTAFRGDGHLIHQYRVDLADGRRALVAGIAPHDLGLSGQRELTTVLVVLFVASTVISVLMVLMIRKRFQWPLNRLLRGLEKTAEGEMFVMAENFDDNELDKLATSFNVMSRRLWKNRQELTDYNRRLKKLNMSLLESQLFFSTLVESSPLCIVVTSPAGQILLFNRQACADFSYRASDAVGKNINELFAGSSAGGRVRLEVSDDGMAFETRCRRRGGDFFPAYVISRTARGRDGSVAANIYIIKDITESKGFQDMMVRLDRYYTRGEMAGDIAHEINNYLSILLGNIELLPMVLRSGDESNIQKKLNIMRDTADRIARFTDGLMEGPQDEANIEPCDLNQLVANILAFLKPQNKFDDITLCSELSSDLSLVELDSGQLQQLLVNFVYNAADAMQSVTGQRMITIRTEAVERNLTPHARIEVIDTGPGVAPDKLPLLFQRRFTTKAKGHGIGLITCRKIAEMHGGDIGYEYRDGGVFSVVIPVRRARTGAGHAAASYRADTPSVSAGVRDA